METLFSVAAWMVVVMVTMLAVITCMAIVCGASVPTMFERESKRAEESEPKLYDFN